jgi:hypothetical protein
MTAIHHPKVKEFHRQSDRDRKKVNETKNK